VDRLETGGAWCYDFTHFTRAKRVAVAVVDVVSHRWLVTLVCAEEMSSQVQAAFHSKVAVHLALGRGGRLVGAVVVGGGHLLADEGDHRGTPGRAGCRATAHRLAWAGHGRPGL
jgi:hypothetical protein